MNVRNSAWLRKVYRFGRDQGFSFSTLRNHSSALFSRAKLPVLVAGCTATGKKRSKNQDDFDYDRGLGLFVVCDGMGGAACGDLASRLAVQAALDTTSDRMKAYRTSAVQEQSTDFCLDRMRCTMVAAVDEANRVVYERSQSQEGLSGMGTTLVMLRIVAKTARLAHVGDSRGYLWRGGQLKRLTSDHSWIEEQIRLGQMSEEEARHAPYRNLITRALGPEPSVVADYTEFALLSGDLLLLTSDGLTNELEDAEIAAMLAAHPSDRLSAQLEERAAQPAAEARLKGLCTALVDAANEHGGRDNITCLLVQIL